MLNKTNTSRLFKAIGKSVFTLGLLFALQGTAQSQNELIADASTSSNVFFAENETRPAFNIKPGNGQKMKLSTSIDKEISYRIFNLKWEEVASGKLPAGERTISYAQLPSADYIVKFKIGKEGRVMHLPK